MEIKINDVFQDYKIVDICKKDGDSRNYYKTECLICGRNKLKPRKSLISKSGTSHQSCNSLLKKDDAFYRRYMSMRTRTTNPRIERHEQYKNVSSEYYKLYIDFYDDLYESYQCHVEKFGVRNTTLDRIDPSGDYVKGNVRWATIGQQNNNTRKHMKKYLAKNIQTGEEIIFSNQTEFSKNYNISKSSVNNLIHKRRTVIKFWEINELK